MRVQPVPCVSTPAPVPWGIWASSEPPAGPILPELGLGCAPGRSGARDHLPARVWEASGPPRGCGEATRPGDHPVPLDPAQPPPHTACREPLEGREAQHGSFCPGTGFLRHPGARSHLWGTLSHKPVQTAEKRNRCRSHNTFGCKPETPRDSKRSRHYPI